MIVNSPESTVIAINKLFVLIEDYEANLEEIAILEAKILTYEATAQELKNFNEAVK